MYAGRVACCPLVSHVEYAPRTLLSFKKMEQTDRWTPDRYITLTVRRGYRNMFGHLYQSINQIDSFISGSKAHTHIQ